MNKSSIYTLLPAALPIRVPGLLACVIGFGIPYWFHPVSLAYVLTSFLIGGVFSVLTLAHWAYRRHLGSLGFWIASIVVITIGYRLARNIAGYDRSSDNDLWVLTQFYTAAAFVFFSTLCLLHKYFRADV
jgi:hypothetical protein